METAEKSKEAVGSEFNLTFSGTSGCQYEQTFYEHQSQLNADHRGSKLLGPGRHGLAFENILYIYPFS